MSLSNAMEIISKSSVDFSEANSTCLSSALSRSSTSHSVRTDSQLSLECLPPEVPYYSGSGVSTQSYASDTKSKDDTSSAEILHDRIREISDRIHGLTSLDRQQNSGHDYKELFNSPPRNSGGLTTDVASYLEGSTNGRDNASSRNSTLVDDEGELTYSSSDESSSIDGTELGEQATNSSSVSRATMVHSEICNFSRSAPEVGFHEDIEVNGLDSGSDGDNQRRENGSSNESIGTRTTRSSSHDSGMDPKLFKALEKMRKLDERLANITKKEREVKRQRRLLEQQLSSLSDDGQSSTELVALDCEDSQPVSPVFVTRLEDNSSTAGDRPRRSSSDSHSSLRKEGEREERKGREKQTSKKAHHDDGHHDNPHGTNFIKRNIELASEAGAAVSMTESEKKRLEQLLCDSTELEDPYSGPEVVGAIEGGGFTYSKEDLDKMRNIDSRLQLMLPPSDWDSICSSSSLSTTTPTNLPHSEQTDVPHASPQSDKMETFDSLEPTDSSSTTKQTAPGEEVLHHFQISREESQRLKDIEERLLAIKEENERIEQAIVPLPVVDLQSLIEQCTRELQCSSVCGRGSSRSRSSESGRTDCEQTDLATSDDVV